jgi:hypothetical protein
MDRKGIEAAVAENSHFRGLFGVVGGLLAILAALGNAAWGPLRHDWVFITGVIVLAGLTWPINNFYTARFGRATPSNKQRVRLAVVVVVAIPLVIVGSLWLSSRVSWSLDLPVNTTAVTLGLVFLLSIGASVGIRVHHVVIYGGLVLLGTLPVWERGGESGNTGLWLAGIAMIISGLLDHRLLVRRFGPAAATGVEVGRAGI